MRDLHNSETQKTLVYYESIKRELKIRPIYECRCDERLKLKLRNLHAPHTLKLELRDLHASPALGDV